MAPAPILNVSGLSKRFGARVAVDALTLEVAPGEIVGLLGPNGAGKTTVLKCVLGLVRPDSGMITACGIDARRNGAEARARIGSVPQRTDPADETTGRELLGLVARLRGVPAAEIAHAAERAGATDVLDQRLATLSGGQLQRVVLAQALLGDPPLLVLDEPTVSLDPLAQHDYMRLLERLKGEGKALLLSSHLLSEVERVADAAIVLERGRTVGRWRRADWQECGLEALFLEALGRVPEDRRAAS